MADKRITDFATAAEALDDDLLLISSKDETYNIKVKSLKDAVMASAAQAESAAADANRAKEAADAAAEIANNAAQNALDAAGRLPANIVVKSIVIPEEGWSSDPDGSYAFYVDVQVVGATEQQYVNVLLSPASIETVKNIEMCQIVETKLNSIRFWAMQKPGADIQATAVLFTHGEGTSF